MKKFLSLPALLCLLLLVACTPTNQTVGSSDDPVIIQGRGTSECALAAQNRLSQQQRLFRTVLFGQRPAADEPLNTIRHQEDGTPWMKITDNVWRSADLAVAGNELQDEDIDAQTEWATMNEPDANPAGPRTRKGLLEVRGDVTPVEALAHSYRALQCRLEMVCAGIRLSASNTEIFDEMLTVQTPGCTPLTMPHLALQCGGSDDGRRAQDESECRQTAQAILDREAAFLQFAVAYDASYRSLLQFAGNFDAITIDAQNDVLGPIDDALVLIRQLSRIPCFAAQCNE